MADIQRRYLQRRTVVQLRQICRENRFKGFSKHRKAELIDFILERADGREFIQLLTPPGYVPAIYYHPGSEKLDISLKGLREINFEIPDTCKILNCSRNDITELPEDLKNVEVLICHTNRLTHLPEDLKKVRRIECYNNQITHLPADLKKVKKINCNCNRILKLPEDFKNLEILYCHTNRIRKIPKDLKNLKELSCSSNNIRYLPRDFKNLRKLWCSNNKIAFIPRDFKELRLLKCSRNLISHFPRDLKNLSNLDIYYNPGIKNFISDVSKLTTFRYEGNDFDYISMEMLRFLGPLDETRLKIVNFHRFGDKIQHWYKARRLTRLGIPKLITYYAHGFV